MNSYQATVKQLSFAEASRLDQGDTVYLPTRLGTRLNQRNVFEVEADNKGLTIYFGDGEYKEVQRSDSETGVYVVAIEVEQ